MKLQPFTAILLIGVSVALPAHSSANCPGAFLHREDCRTLTEIARRAQSMMTIAPFTRTAVWHPSTLDARGHAGMFVSSLKPLFHSEELAIREQHEAWLLVSLLAVVKYAENSEELIDYIGFTDANGQSGEVNDQRWYYRLDMDTAVKIQRAVIAEKLKAGDAIQQIRRSWTKVTEHSEFASR
jgi:hypothetical protein